jgi:hypothetical protein
MADMDFDQTIGIAPQFSSYAIDERQVLLLSEQRSFRLTGSSPMNSSTKPSIARSSAATASAVPIIVCSLCLPSGEKR